MNQDIKNRINQIKNGQVPEGYEKTSFGVFPVDWEKKKTLGNIFDFYGGLGIPRDKLGEKGIPYLHYGDMHRNAFTKVTHEQYSKLPKYDTTINENKTYLMKDGDLVFLDASEDLEGTSRCVLIDNPDDLPFIAGLHTFVAREKKSVYAKYYKQYITSINSIKKQFYSLAVGFKVSGLNRNTIKKIKIAYPKSQTEQAKIAEILMKWDEAIEAQQQLIQKLEIRKKALMQKLLTPKEGWEKIRLKDILVNVYNRVGKNNYEPVAVGVFGIRKRSEIFDKELSTDYSSNKVFRKNQICFGIGTNAIVYDVLLEDATYCVSPAYKVYDINNIHPFFLKLILDKNNKYLSNKYLIISIRQDKAIDFDGLFNELILVPNNQEQKRIANILSLADKEIELHKQQLEQLTKQRKSLMQLLLTGIVRTV